MDIKNRWSGTIIFSDPAKTMKETILAALKSGANLSGANLSRANLSRANLSGAILSGANLSGANLSRANLSRANLSGANLSRANLSGADLSRANLSGANLSRANLSRANLSGANLSRANLSKAKNAEIVIARTVIVPEGDIIGYKKCYNGIIAKVLIPAKAKRSNAHTRKCRASFVQVIELSDTGGKPLPKGTIAYSSHDMKTAYRKGKIVKADEWDEDRWNECSHGIHFFLTREEAVAY